MVGLVVGMHTGITKKLDRKKVANQVEGPGLALMQMLNANVVRC